MMTRADQDPVKRLGLWVPVLAAGGHPPPPRGLEVVGGNHLTDRRLKLDVFQQTEVLSVQSEILEDVFVRHESGELRGRGEIAEGHHFFAGVDDTGPIHTPLADLWIITVVPQPPNIILPLKTHGLYPLVQAALDGSQPAAARSDDRHPFHF